MTKRGRCYPSLHTDVEKWLRKSWLESTADRQIDTWVYAGYVRITLDRLLDTIQFTGWNFEITRLQNDLCQKKTLVYTREMNRTSPNSSEYWQSDVNIRSHFVMIISGISSVVWWKSKIMTRNVNERERVETQIRRDRQRYVIDSDNRRRSGPHVRMEHYFEWRSTTFRP